MQISGFYLLALVLLLSLSMSSSFAFGQQAKEIEKLTKIIKSKIQHDKSIQDSSIIILSMNVQIDDLEVEKNSSLNRIAAPRFHKTRFCYTKGFNLRFYVLSSNSYKNDGFLQIKKSGNFNKTPEKSNASKVKFFHKIIDSSLDLNITHFDYPLNYYEEFELSLSLEKKAPGCAVAIVTIYPQKAPSEKN